MLIGVQRNFESKNVPRPFPKDGEKNDIILDYANYIKKIMTNFQNSKDYVVIMESNICSITNKPLLLVRK